MRQHEEAIKRTLHQFSESLGNAIDVKDSYTESHSVEVAEAAYLLANAMGLPWEMSEWIHIGGHLHDIGKIGVPNRILHKNSPLTPEEWAVARRHPEIGAHILAPVEAMAETGIPEMVLHHHEAFDGGGYPFGLKGRAIPVGARIIAAADSLSAMLSHRPYRRPDHFADAVAEIARCAGSQFDPEVVGALEANSKEVKAAMGRHNGRPRPGMVLKVNHHDQKPGGINCRSRLTGGNPVTPESENVIRR